MTFRLSEKSRIALAFACVYFFWGSTYGAIHIAGPHLAPPLVGAVRTLVSTAILYVFCLVRGISLRLLRAPRDHRCREGFAHRAQPTSNRQLTTCN